MLDKLKRLIVLTGHYGCGKTNLALNLAYDYKARGEDVSIVDLDIVNPYFTTSDYTKKLTEKGIHVTAPKYAGTLTETPSLSREISAVLTGEDRVIVDLGGDDVGARALGRFYHDILSAGGLDMIYLFSIYRPQTRDIYEVISHMNSVEAASRQKIGYLINSSNLGQGTKEADIENSINFSEELSKISKVPLLTTVEVSDNKMSDVPNRYYIKRYVKLPWER